MRTVLAIDAGTTGTRAALINDRGDASGLSYRRLTTRHRSGGVVEQDLSEILSQTCDAIRSTLHFAADNAIRVDCVAVAAQRLTSGLWDAETGEPVAPAMVWQDSRYADELARLGDTWNDELLGTVGRQTGLRSGYLWAATALKSHDAIRERHESGRLRFGTVDTWLIWNLCQGRPLVTSASMAAASGAYDLRHHRYFYPYVDELGFPRDLLPTLVDDDATVGVGVSSVFGEPLEVRALVGDQQAGLLGMGVRRAGQAAVVHGTGSFCSLYSAAERPTHVRDEPLALVQVARRTRADTHYAVETFAEMTGAGAQWLCDSLRMFASPKEISAAAGRVTGSAGVIFVPCLSGLRLPVPASQATARLTGLSSTTTADHIAFAFYEGITHFIRICLAADAAVARTPITEVIVGGGLAAADPLLQIHADLLGVPIRRCADAGVATLRGAAFLAASDGTLWSGLDEAISTVEYDDTFAPALDDPVRAARTAAWNSQLEAILTT